MPSFTYWARDASGRMVVGTLEGADERAVAGALGHQGFHPIRIQPQERGAARSAPAGSHRRVDRQDVLILFRELASLLRAGIPLASGLDGAVQQTRSQGLHTVLTDVARRVQGGESFSDALGAHPGVFPELFISMIRVGETAGILDQVLERLAQLGMQELETRSRIRSALVYPVVLVVLALIVVIGLLVGVLPKFVGVFEASNVVLPLPTRILLSISGAIRDYWWMVLLAGAGAIWGVRQYYASSGGRWTLDRAVLKVPVFGTLWQKVMVAQITRTLGSMLKTGVPLLEALSVAEKTIPNVVFRRALQQTRLAVAEGKSLSEPLTASGLFPHLMVQLVTVGERSGQLDDMLIDVARFYEPEIDLSVRNFTTLLEPILLLVMGLVVGFIALSVLLPIFQLIHVFKK